MLRASISTYGGKLDPRPIATGVGATGIDADAELIAFVDAVVLMDVDEFPDARTALEAVIGREATDRAAMVAGNFSMMNRALDAVGAPVDANQHALATEMGLAVPEHLRPNGA